MSDYDRAIRNIRNYIKMFPAGTEGSVDAFTASTVIAIAFKTTKEIVISDILNVDINAS